MGLIYSLIFDFVLEILGWKGRRRPTSVQVRAVVTERQRQPRGREAWLDLASPYQCQVVELMTDSATLEWAVPEDKLEWTMARVAATF